MTIYYRDEGGIVREHLLYDSVYANSIDFADGKAYFTSEAKDEDGYYIERKIPVQSIVRIEF